MSIRVEHGDSRDVLKTLADASIDAVVTDPPYSLVSIQKRFGKPGQAPATEGVYRRAAAGFMGKQWDTGETAFDPAFWAEVLRVLKPGGHLVAFGGTRTYHRLACAIEDGGFEIMDQIGWAFGSGFPKSHNAGDGWGTALKPAWEPICLARKPLMGTVATNIYHHCTGALNIDRCRVGTGESLGRFNNAKPEENCVNDSHPNAKNLGRLQQTAAFIDNSAGKGRWPANLIHDGSEEVLAAFPEPHGAGAERSADAGTCSTVGSFGLGAAAMRFGDNGSAARFFYSAKADKADRLGSKHPTVKPVDLMAYLCRLVTPVGGTVLDPFAGSGSTGMACMREGFDCILIEREAEYIADIQRRLKHVDGSDAPLFAEAALL